MIKQKKMTRYTTYHQLARTNYCRCYLTRVQTWLVPVDSGRKIKADLLSHIGRKQHL